MTRRPIATVTVLTLPHLHPDAIRVEIDCPASATGITHIPGGAIEMDIPMLTTFATYGHEERCDAGCDTSRAHARGDRRAREYIERMKAAMQVKQVQRYVEARRN
jgi:hypothetical protein